ncbi:hypothetical protein [Streptomyces sp. NPDC051657]|uniref:PIN domain-containing protein n=1 Tax=unclassified Streptomyces TaxID=2593676 RepID=UPI00344168BC
MPDAALDEDWDGCIGCLRRWEPHDASARSMRVQLEAASLVGLDRQSEALALLRTADSEGLFTSVTVRLAETLLQYAAPTASRLTSAQEALAVAVRARNNRRNWYADSAEAAVLAVQAAVLCGDLAAAWNMTQPSPEGEATTHEADDDRMREQTALVAALTGRLREAEQLANSLNSAFIKAQAMALIAEMRLDGESENPQVQGLWQQAWEAAQTDSEQLVAAMGLAEAGADLPDLAHLRARFAEAVTEIELLARALRGRSGDELGVLRANITQSPVIVLKLAQRYRRGGDRPMVAQTLQEGARQFHDVRLMVMAAGLFRGAGDHSHARECAHSALTMGGADWAGRGRIYALLVEVESADGRMPQATDAALQLLALDPWDTDARWALVKCYTGRAMPEQAWQALAEPGTPLQPRSRDEALLWVGLGADMSTDRHFIGHAMALMQRWPDDEELLGRLLGALHWRAVGKADDLSEGDAEQLRTATATFLERFPNSAVFRTIAVGPPDNPLVNLGEELRRTHENVSEVNEKVAKGEFPAGLLAVATGRTYAEVLLHRTVEKRGTHAIDVPVSSAETAAARAAGAVRGVLDTSAAVTLALLPAGVREQLIGRLQSVVTTDQLLGDALRAKESASLRSDMSVVWDEHRAAPTVQLATAEELSGMRSMAERLVEILQATARVSRPEVRSLPGLPPGRRRVEWLTAFDYAMEHGWALWCDDRVLRAAAASQGVPSFGTVALLDDCRADGSLSPDEHVVLTAELLRHHYVDIPFSATVYCAAAQADGWQAHAVAAAVSRPTAWADAQATVEFVLDATSRIIPSSPEAASQWLAAAYAGLHRATLPSHRTSNLRSLTWQTLMQPWVSPSTLPFVLAGLRSGMAAVDDSDAALRAALSQYYGALADKLGHLTASGAMMGLFSLANEEDRAAAVRIVLTHPGR